jgi:hypothetical protein
MLPFLLRPRNFHRVYLPLFLAFLHLIPVALPSVSFLMAIRKVLSSSYFKMAARRSWLDAATRFIILLPGPARNWLYLVWSEPNELRRILQATGGYFCARWEIRFQSSTISVGWILNSKFWHLASHLLLPKILIVY